MSTPNRAILLIALLGVTAASAHASELPDVSYAADEKVGIFERLGETVPLDVRFRDEQGQEVVLKDLLRRPTILTLVYYNCPSICSPLLRELGSMVDKVDVVAGVDYDLITLSFDIDETPELARENKRNLLRELERKIPPTSWHFLTGDAENIERLTEAVGFEFKKDDRGEFVHAGTVIFLTPEGKIVRYLNGKNLLPADLKLAVLDAVEGKTLNLIQRVQRICYVYDPEGKTYELQINRIVLGVTLMILGAFLVFLMFRRGRAPEAPTGGSPAERAT